MTRRRSLYPTQSIVRIVMLLVGLVAVLALRVSCSEGIADFMQGWDVPDAGQIRR